ncbi:MAG TPA: hypothetical protein VIL44_07335 [Micromonospora sp.]
MQDAWRAYLGLALGVTEASRKKAEEIVRKLVGKGGATAAQLQALAEELRAVSAANREALTRLVRAEIDRAVGALGLATADDVAELTRRIEELERNLQELRVRVAGDTPGPVGGVAGDGAILSEPAAAGSSARETPSHTEAPPVKKVAKKAVKKAVKKATKAAAPRKRTGAVEHEGGDAR